MYFVGSPLDKCEILHYFFVAYRAHNSICFNFNSRCDRVHSTEGKDPINSVVRNRVVLVVDLVQYSTYDNGGNRIHLAEIDHPFLHSNLVTNHESNNHRTCYLICSNHRDVKPLFNTFHSNKITDKMN